LNGRTLVLTLVPYFFDLYLPNLNVLENPQMKFSFYLLLLFTSISVFAQSPKIDSLENLLKKAPSDTTRVNLLIELTNEYWASSPEKTLQYAEKALILSKKAGYLRGEARSYQGFGIYYWQKNNHAASLENYNKSKKIYEKIGDKVGEAKAIGNIGLVYAEQGNYSQALDNYLQAMAIFRNIGDNARVASMTNSMGNVYKNQKNFDEALASYKQAQEIWSKLDDQKSIAGSFINIGTIYSKQKKFDEAVMSIEKGLKIFENFHDSNGQILCHNHLGEIHLQKGEYPVALAEYEKALALNSAYQSKKLMTTSYIGLSNVYSHMDQYGKAITGYKQAQDLALASGLRPALQQAYEGLANVYGHNKDYANAFHFQQLSTVLKDSLYNAENTNKIANLRVHYESEKKQSEILLLQKEKDLGYATRNTVAVALLAGLVLLALAFNRQRLKVRKNRELHQVQQALAETEIRNSLEKEQQLTAELEFRNKALTTHTLNLIQKNSILEEIRQTISLTLKGSQRDENAPLFSKLINLIDYSFNLDRDWDEFKMYFEGVHKDFFFKLKKANPDLSVGELRLCALIRLNLNLKEASTLLSISPDSVKTARHRLRKKLNLSEENNLSDYLMTI
jgi:tetratricopeptide (TPR) repeat protein